jgi:hypothetical protein
MMNRRIMSRYLAAALALLLAAPALGAPAFASSSGNAMPAIDWSHFLWGGLIAAGLWIAANIAGQLWIRWRSSRAKRPEA